MMLEAEIRAVPGGQRTRRHGARRRLRDSAAQRCGAGHSETYIGLVECGIGLLPGWGGCKEMLGRWATADMPRGPMPAPSKVFETVSTATVSKSAADAKESVPAPHRRHHHESLPAAGRRQGARARWWKTTSRRSPRIKLPGPVRQGGDSPWPWKASKRGMATTRYGGGGELADRAVRRPDTDLIDVVTEDQLLELERACRLRCELMLNR
jgi:3-hydroxyacyl-CoA dehydrogenase